MQSSLCFCIHCCAERTRPARGMHCGESGGGGILRMSMYEWDFIERLEMNATKRKSLQNECDDFILTNERLIVRRRHVFRYSKCVQVQPKWEVETDDAGKQKFRV